jgi:hypothetical protein
MHERRRSTLREPQIAGTSPGIVPKQMAPGLEPKTVRNIHAMIR